MKRLAAWGILTAVFGGFAVMWSPARWAASVPQLAVGTLFLLWWLYRLKTREVMAWPFLAWPMTGLLAYGAVQLWYGWTVYPWDTQEAGLYWFTNLLSLLLTADACRDTEIRRRVRDGLYYGGVILALVSLLQFYTSGGRIFWIFPGPGWPEVYGPFVYKNQYAAFLELLIPLALVRALTGNGARWPAVISGAALFACAVASDSRAGVLLASAEMLVIPAILVWKRAIAPGTWWRCAATLVVTATIFTLVVGPETVTARLQTRDLYAGRSDLWAASVTMFRDRPVKGFGLGTWATAYPAYATDDDGLIANQAHNDWAQAAVEGGLPALLCLAAIFVWSASAGWRTVWGLGLSVLLLHAVVDYPIQRQAIAVCFFSLAGLQAASNGADLHRSIREICRNTSQSVKK